jgi:hypothetical protein
MTLMENRGTELSFGPRWRPAPWGTTHDVGGREFGKLRYGVAITVLTLTLSLAHNSPQVAAIVDKEAR